MQVLKDSLFNISFFKNMENRIIKTSTVIVGAGISGLSAAVNLLENDYDDFYVLEALDRIGGRCHTLNLENGILELGAQFIHGQKDNPIYELAKANRLIDECFNEILFESDDEMVEHNAIKIDVKNHESETQYFVTQHGHKIPFQLAIFIYNQLNKAIRIAEGNLDSVDRLESDKSLGEFLYAKFNELIKNHEQDIIEKFQLNDSNELKQISDAFFIWRSKCENVENGCSNIYDLSLKNFCLFNELKGSQIIEPIKGYKSIIDTFLSNKKEEFEQRLKLNHVLKKIYVCRKLLSPQLGSSLPCTHCSFTNDENKIVLVVSTKSADNNQEEEKLFICDNVLCTMSLGYLKHNITNLIEPIECVPEEKLVSIQRLGFGTVNKIILTYEKPFWKEDLEGINLIWMPKNTDSANVAKLSHENIGKEKPWFQDICIFEPAKDFENTLIGWLSGNELYEQLDDQAVIQDCTTLFEQFFNKSDIPYPKSIMRSKWYSNEFFKGSYSHYPLGSDSNDANVVAQPIELKNALKIMFAGEHTHAEFYSTVHGAFLTGKRESKRILNRTDF